MVWVIILILSIIILLLSIGLFLIIKKATYLSKKERDFIIFTIDIYTDYGEELKLNSVEEHEIIIENLKKIKNKIEKIDE